MLVLLVTKVCVRSPHHKEDQADSHETSDHCPHEWPLPAALKVWTVDCAGEITSEAVGGVDGSSLAGAAGRDVQHSVLVGLGLALVGKGLQCAARVCSHSRVDSVLDGRPPTVCALVIAGCRIYPSIVHEDPNFLGHKVGSVYPERDADCALCGIMLYHTVLCLRQALHYGSLIDTSRTSIDHAGRHCVNGARVTFLPYPVIAGIPVSATVQQLELAVVLGEGDGKQNKNREELHGPRSDLLSRH